MPDKDEEEFEGCCGACAYFAGTCENDESPSHEMEVDEDDTCAYQEPLIG